jgi:Protein of unknown function with HXXEE motif
MTLAQGAWLAQAAYALHILEEFAFDWRNWARTALHLPVDWPDFYVTNAVVVVLGLVQAELAPSLPLAPLTFAALMLINATFFHLLPFLRAGGRFSPGLFTAVILFYPLAGAMFMRAAGDGVLDAATLAGAILGGAILMAFPVAMLFVKDRPYFRQK